MRSKKKKIKPRLYYTIHNIPDIANSVTHPLIPYCNAFNWNTGFNNSPFPKKKIRWIFFFLGLYNVGLLNPHCISPGNRSVEALSFLHEYWIYYLGRGGGQECTSRNIIKQKKVYMLHSVHKRGFPYFSLVCSLYL